MARKQRKGKAQGGPGQGAPQGGGATASQAKGSASWAPLRDALRRDVEQAVAALAFARRLHEKLDNQRRVFTDFPRSLEQLRSGSLERVASALSRIYEGGQGFDLQRFLRDLPLALAQLAVAERKAAAASAPPPAAPASTPPAAAAPTPPSEASGEPASAPPPGSNGVAAEPPPASTSPAVAETPAEGAPVSPRVELRARLLAAAPQLAKAATTYRRNVATLKRAAQPRRAPGPWRTDREVLEEAQRAVDFVQKLYDTYAEAWADQPLPPDLAGQTAAEVDRFLAWTQLDRYQELALVSSRGEPRAQKPGQQILGGSQPPPLDLPVTEASPGAVVAASDPGPAGEIATEPEAGSPPEI